MTTRNSQSGEKNQTSAGDSTSRDQESARKRRNQHQEPAMEERLATQPADHEGKLSRVMCDAKPRGYSNAREAFSSACLEHETGTRSQPTTGSKADREAVSRVVSGRLTRSDDAKNSQGWDPKTHERKNSANSRQSCDSIVRAVVKEESENPRIRCELQSWTSSC